MSPPGAKAAAAILATALLPAAAALFMAPLPGAAGGEPQVFLHETFDNLDAWKPLTFPKIREHSTYSLVDDGGNRVLRAESKASASGIVLTKNFDVRQFPRMRWRWKVDNVYARGDVTSKSGDDYPIRLYVLFRYDPGRAGFGRRLQYGAARLVYGEYPPDSAVNYTWSSRPGESGVHVSPYTDRARMIVLESGPARAGQWVDEEVDILADYRKAFGEEPPAEAGLAVMNDSDNTGESAVSYVDDIVVWGDSPSP